MKSAVLLVFIVLLSACVSQLNPQNPSLNPFSPSFNPFGTFQQKTVRPAEGLKVSLDAQPDPVFAGSKATVFFDAQNKDITLMRNIFLDIFDTGNLAKEEKCQLSSSFLLPDQIVSLTCPVRAKEIIQKTQTETINARAKFQSVLAAVQSFDIMSEEVYNREVLAGNIKPKPRSYAYKDNNVELLVEFSDMPVVVRKDKQYFVYFTIKNIGNGFMDKITFGENFLPVQQNNLRFSEVQGIVTGFKTAGARSFIDLFDLLVKNLQNVKSEEQVVCGDILCCRDFKTIYPTGRTFPRIACELKLQQEGKAIEQAVDYQVLIPLIYDYEVRATSQLRVVR